MSFLNRAVQQHLTVLKFETENAKQKVENAVDEILYWSPLFSKVHDSDPVVTLDAEREPIDDLQLKSLRAMMEALFNFIRQKPDLTREFSATPFWEVVENSILRLGAALIRCANFSDHHFLLTHLVNTAKTDEWQASSLLQFPHYDAVAGWSQTECNHFASMLVALLSPLAKPTALTVDLPPSAVEVQNILSSLRSDRSAAPYIIAEEDLIAHLKQFPFDEILCSVLFVANDFAGLPTATVRSERSAVIFFFLIFSPYVASKDESWLYAVQQAALHAP